jgi:hypothetical protein
MNSQLNKLFALLELRTTKITKKRVLCKYTSTSFIEALIYTAHSPVAEKLHGRSPSTESITIIQTLTLEKVRSFQELQICYWGEDATPELL